MNDKGGITPGQLRKIWAAAHELGWDDHRLHEELEQVIGVVSLKDLTVGHAKLFIDYLVSEGATPGRYHTEGVGRGPARAANLIPMVSPAQRNYLTALRKALHLEQDTPYWCTIVTRSIGHSRIRTMDEASKLIGILRTLVDRYQGEAPGNLGRTDRDRSNGA